MNNILGFTGTRAGMTRAQQKAVRHFLTFVRVRNVAKDTVQAIELHNGACHGADRDMWAIYWEVITGRVIFWPSNENQNNWATGMRNLMNNGSVVNPVSTPLERNRDIVDASAILVATPKEFAEVKRSGTWMTIRYARSINRPIMLVLPDGRVQKENV